MVAQVKCEAHGLLAALAAAKQYSRRIDERNSVNAIRRIMCVVIIAANS